MSFCASCGTWVPYKELCRCSLQSPAVRIHARIAEKRAEYENFKGYLAMRTREEDLHGIWDAGVNMSEVSSYIDGLQFALQALGEKET